MHPVPSNNTTKLSLFSSLVRSNSSNKKPTVTTKTSTTSSSFSSKMTSINKSGKNTTTDKTKNKSKKNSSSSSRVVSFSKRVVVRNCRHLNDYLEEEKEASFYQPCDYKRINADIQFTLQLIEDEMLLDDQSEEFCRRGLEYRTREGMALRRTNRTMSVLAVMATQDEVCCGQSSLNERLQQGGGNTQVVSLPSVSTDEAIAEAYAKQVQESTSLACLTGMLDEKAAATNKKGVQEKLYQQQESSSSQITCNRFSTPSTSVARVA